ncbi:hypothetical protein ALC53_00250, partial [Atta colombica]
PNFGRKKSYEQKIMMPRKIRQNTYRFGMSVFKHKKVRPGENEIDGPLCSGVRRVHDSRICRGNQELRGKWTEGQNRVKLYKILKRKYFLILTQFHDNLPSRKIKNEATTSAYQLKPKILWFPVNERDNNFLSI